MRWLVPAFLVACLTVASAVPIEQLSHQRGEAELTPAQKAANAKTLCKGGPPSCCRKALPVPPKENSAGLTACLKVATGAEPPTGKDDQGKSCIDKAKALPDMAARSAAATACCDA